MLSLGHISKKQKLGFVSKIRSLRRLVIILGGREDISEIQHDSLEELEILRVLGFNNIESVDSFPSLRSLAIEDQIRLESIRFSPSNRNLESLRIFNCKNGFTEPKVLLPSTVVQLCVALSGSPAA